MSIKVLLVEDSEIESEAVFRLLGDDGYAMTHAATGDEARALLDDPFDIVLLDYRLPDVEEVELLEEMVNHDLPVIILTVEENPQTIINTMQAGALDYLLKREMSTERLRHSINNSLERACLLRETAEQQRTLAKQNVEIRQLVVALTLAEQREQQRIARILHDEVQQILHGLQMRVMLLQGEHDDENLVEMNQLISEALTATRTLAVELSPPVLHSDGLVEALRWLVAHMHERYRLEVELKTVDLSGELHDDIQRLVFRLVRELLFNVVKHANVKEAAVTLAEHENALEIRVEDGGEGFDTDILDTPLVSRLGITGYGRRLRLVGGTFNLESTLGEGTRATLSVPLI